MNWLHFAIGILITALQSTIKNPGSLAKEKLILLQVRDHINEIFPGE